MKVSMHVRYMIMLACSYRYSTFLIWQKLQLAEQFQVGNLFQKVPAQRVQGFDILGQLIQLLNLQSDGSPGQFVDLSSRSSSS